MAITLSVSNPFGVLLNITIVTDPGGATVYTGAHYGGDSFSPGPLPPGNYIMYVNNNGAINGFCFTVQPCACMVPTTTEFVEVGGLLYFDMKFDMDIIGPICPTVYTLNTTILSGGGPSYTIFINEFADFTSCSGSICTYRLLVPFDTLSIAYRTFLDTGINWQLSPCYPTIIAEHACNGPQVNAFEIQYDGDNIVLHVDFDAIGSMCHTVDFNVQVSRGGYTSLPITFTATLGALTQDFNIGLLSSFPGAGLPISVSITAINCCGTIVVSDSSSWPTGCAPALCTSITAHYAGGNYYARVTINACGGTCSDYTILKSQMLGAGESWIGMGEWGVLPTTPLSCSDPFPHVQDYLLTPGSTTGESGAWHYNIFFWDCCSSGYPVGDYSFMATLTLPFGGLPEEG
jgi:hypothetical protein